MPEALLSTTCTLAWVATPGGEVGAEPTDQLALCGEPAIAVLTFACVHEHVVQGPGCAGCATEMQQCADTLGCIHCAEGPDPHKCKMTMKIEWSTGEVTHHA